MNLPMPDHGTARRPGWLTSGSVCLPLQVAQALQAFGRERGGADVGQHLRQVAHLPLCVQQSGLLGALGAVA